MKIEKKFFLKKRQKTEYSVLSNHETLSTSLNKDNSNCSIISAGKFSSKTDLNSLE